MDAIAAASGVSKATIYKHWPNKEKLCLEVLRRLHGLDAEEPAFHSGDLRRDLIAQLKYEPAPARRGLRVRILPHLIAYSVRHRAFGELWRKQAMERPRARLTETIRRGIEAKALAPDIDLGTALALLLGPLIYRRIFSKSFGDTLPADFEERVVDAFLRANAPPAGARSASLPEGLR